MKPEDVFESGRIRVVRSEWCWDSLLYSLRPVPVQGFVSTAVDEDLRIYWGPEAMALYGPEIAGGMIRHEIGHVAQDYFKRARALLPRALDLAGKMGYRDKEAEAQAKLILNLCGDLEIHTDEFLEKWPLPKLLPPGPDGVRVPFDPATPQKYKMPSGLTLESYFQLIVDRAQEQPQKNYQPLCGGCGAAHARGMLGQEPDVPDHSQVQTDVILRVTHEKIVEYDLQNPGTLPGGLVMWARKSLRPSKVPWRSVLSRKLRTAVEKARGALDYSYSGLSRRQQGPVVLPTMTGPKLTGVIVLDSSGSMEGTAIEDGTRETMGVIKACGIPLLVLCGDVMVQRAKRVADERGMSDVVVGGGGTDMRELVREAIEEHGAKLIVLITDGGTPWPTKKEMGKTEMVVCLVGRHQCEPPPDRGWVVLRVKEDESEQD